MGSLSFVIGQKAAGYKDLPDFPLEAPDASVRNIEIVSPSTGQHDSARKSSATGGKKEQGNDQKFYSDEDETSTEGPDSEDEDEEDEEEEEEEEVEEEEKEQVKSNEYEQLDAKSTNNTEQASEEEDSEEEEEEDSSEEEEESEDEEEESSEDEKVNISLFASSISHISFQPIAAKPSPPAPSKAPPAKSVNDYIIPTTEKSLLEMDRKYT